MTDQTTTDTTDGRIDVDALMERVRAEVRARAGEPGPAGARPNLYIDTPDTGARAARRGDRIAPRESYALSDFLAYGDEDFLRNAYVGVLRRAPDEGGYQHYLDALRTGRLDRVEILARLRYSPEGRAKAVPIVGLRRSAAYRRIRRLPFIGYLVAWSNHFLRLPRLAETAYRSDVAHRAALQALEARLARSERQLASLSARVEQASALAREASQLSATATDLTGAVLAEHSGRRPDASRGSH